MVDSRRVETNQDGLHSDLTKTVLKHLKHTHQLPVQDWMRDVFSEVNATIDPLKPIVLDSGCGTGVSVWQYAQQHPDHQVIGLDRSQERLKKAGLEQGLWMHKENVWLVRCKIEEFWLLAQEARWKLYRHRILYPNPYPKSMHLKRRWYAHPAYLWMLQLGGQLEVRSNWRLYLEEFKYALQLCHVTSGITDYEHLDMTVSAFEAKYLDSKQAISILEADLVETSYGNK